MESVVVKDVLGREVSVGHYVAASTLFHKSAYLRVGKVIRISELGNLTIRVLATWKGKLGASTTSTRGASFLIVPPVTFTEEELQVLES